jgi:aspartate carbamoyltransferase catalytic subunit
MKTKLRHVTDVRKLTPEFVSTVLARASALKYNVRNKSLEHKSICCIAKQASTRTIMSFRAAITQLGGTHDTLPDPEHSSQHKGESFADTIEVLGCYHDIIIIRASDINFPEEAVACSPVPIINAGNGPDQHPTQYLLDRFTIEQKLGTFEGLTIALVGDLANGRAPRSLALGIATHSPKNEVIGVPAEGLEMSDDVKQEMSRRKVNYREVKRLKDVISHANVIYMTRWQKEYSKKHLWGDYPSLTPELAIKADKRAIFMHPLPADRDRELPCEVDQFPQAIYKPFQVRCGLTVRKALLQELLLT